MCWMNRECNVYMYTCTRLTFGCADTVRPCSYMYMYMYVLTSSSLVFHSLLSLLSSLHPSLPPPPFTPSHPPSSEQFIQRKTRPGHFSHSGEPPQLSLPLSVHMHTFLMYCTCTYAIWTQRVLCKHVQLIAQKLFPSNLHVTS